MASATILVVSPDKDFAQPLAEQVKKELSLDCRVAENHEAARTLNHIALVVTHEPQAGYACPVLAVGRQQVRMPQLLADIENALQKPASETLALGAYTLELRAKQLCYKNKRTALTDKEVKLLSSLQAGSKTREALLKEVWDMDAALDTHTLETHIYRLRGKFRELSGEEVIAVTQGGYALKL